MTICPSLPKGTDREFAPPVGKLNGYRFTDKEWTAFFKEKIANQNSGIVEKTAIVQDDYIQLLTREDGSTKNIYLLDKRTYTITTCRLSTSMCPKVAATRTVTT